jgi:hypothetical protein
MTCDVYIRPQTCSVISIYPSQVHPTTPVPPTPIGPGGGGSRPQVVGDRKVWTRDDEESILAALGLFGPNL